MKKNKNLALFGLCILFFMSVSSLYSQQGFQLPEGKSKLKLSFELVNNLIVIPVEINNVTLSFVLDTGVASTILFTAKVDSVALKDTNLISVKGLGQNDSIKAIQSKNNLFSIGNIKDENHTLYVILESQWDVSSRMGVPVHGILGYNLFSKFVVKINYISKTITLYDPETYRKKKCKSCLDLPLTFYKRKPYVSDFFIDKVPENPLLLIDTGASDALWLFDSEFVIEEQPPNYFNDYLGFAIGGEIYGKRSKVDLVQVGDYTIKNVNVSIPSFLNDKRNYFLEKRAGSLGGGLLSRFHVIINYPKKKLYLKPNARFKDPFYYNMSGLTLEQKGVSIIKELASKESSNVYESSSSANIIEILLNYSYKSSSKIVVAKVQEGSPAALADIRKNDEIISINGKPIHQYKLYEIVYMFSNKANKKVVMSIRRNEKNYKKKFRLIPLL